MDLRGNEKMGHRRGWGEEKKDRNYAVIFMLKL